jgi:transmembrane sensor
MMNIEELSVKFLAGEISKEEMELLISALEKSSENRKIFDTTNELWGKTDINKKLEYFSVDEGWSKLSSKLGIRIGRSKSILVINRTKFRILVAAATVACLMTISGLSYWLIERQTANESIVASTIIRTGEGEKAQIYLSDSTQVYMNSGSLLKYDADYNSIGREVKLRGEAFFDVHTNPEKPFVVELSGMTVIATGTKFNILSYGNENRIEATLEEGKIHVAIKDQDTIDVKAGQQVVYFTKTNKAVIQDVKTETYTSWTENKLRLIDTPLEDALRKIGRRYNVVFEIRGHELLDLKYNATFIDESIEEVMQMLQSVTPIRYKIYKRTGLNDKKYLKPKIVVFGSKPKKMNL